MTAPSTQESKAKTRQDKEAEEMQDRIVNLRDQESQVQREAAERGEQDALRAFQQQREQADSHRRQQSEALATIGRQAQQGARQIEAGTRSVARGAASSAATLLPPALTQPGLLLDATFNGVISALSFQRDFWKDLLATGRRRQLTHEGCGDRRRYRSAHRYGSSCAQDLRRSGPLDGSYRPTLLRVTITDGVGARARDR